MMPPMPTTIHQPTDRNDGYYPATVVAAIPLGHGNVYAVTAIEPTSSPDAPTFLAAEVTQTMTGFWVADGDIHPSRLLADALGDMATLAGRVYRRLL